MTELNTRTAGAVRHTPIRHPKAADPRSATNPPNPAGQGWGGRQVPALNGTGASALIPCPVRTGIYGIPWFEMGVNGTLRIFRARFGEPLHACGDVAGAPQTPRSHIEGGAADASPLRTPRIRAGKALRPAVGSVEIFLV